VIGWFGGLGHDISRGAQKLENFVQPKGEKNTNFFFHLTAYVTRRSGTSRKGTSTKVVERREVKVGCDGLQ
jgi:hypothetical protein